MKRNLFLVPLLFFFSACSLTKEERAVQLYKTQCTSCHMAPDIEDLPKKLWKEVVLPEMAARMGIKDSTYSPYRKFPFAEQEAIMKTGIYNVKPTISVEEWKLLKEYIIAAAPEKIANSALKKTSPDASRFAPRVVNIDSLPGTFITFLDIDTEEGTVFTADLAGNVMKFDAGKNSVYRENSFRNATTAYTKTPTTSFATTVGILEPSEIAKGAMYQIKNKNVEEIAAELHRPVHTMVRDLNGNGIDELLVSEFGHLTGALTLFYKTHGSSTTYQKKSLLNQPGIVRTVVKDMDRDGNLDVLLLSTQGNEGVTILYQTDDLQFRSEQVIRFSPIYGSSWFDVLDYNGDGYEDIITVHGDNADKTYVQKPYHGLRIFINDGKNNFEEEYFYPMNGATRFVANDFDKDGDIDFGIIASFPDYERTPEISFVYLENIKSETFTFESFGHEMASLGRWLLIDSGDLDEDGDEDIVLSSFTYSFAPVPQKLSNKWQQSDVDLLILENTLN